ncbi:PorT family protein [Labilibacter sediminis]|nr:PorT family protein [Labilibacter sediminis]
MIIPNNLKKILIIVLIICPLSIKAQDFKAGMLAGGVFSQVDGDSYAGFNKLGLVTGLYVSREFSDIWSGQFEIVYKQKGSRHNPNESIEDYTKYKLNLNYIEVPVMAKIKVNKFSFEGGVTMGMLINSLEEDEYGDVGATVEFEDFEWGSLVGVNYQFHEKMYANIRWAYSLSRVRKAYGGDFDDQKPPHWRDGKFGQYNHSVSLSVYYEFDKLFNR